MTAEAEPEDVDGDSGFVEWEVGGGAGGGVAAVAAYDEGGVDFGGAGGGVGADADDAVVGVFDEAGDFVLHEEVEVGELCGLGGEEVEEVPLGHEGDELFVGGEMGEVGDGEGFAADGEDELRRFAGGEGRGRRRGCPART